jgi:hypothetical protein
MWWSHGVTTAVTVCESAGRLSYGPDTRRRVSVRLQIGPVHCGTGRRAAEQRHRLALLQPVVNNTEKTSKCPRRNIQTLKLRPLRSSRKVLKEISGDAASYPKRTDTSKLLDLYPWKYYGTY